MSTVESLRNRLELEYLEPTTERSPSVPITNAIDSSETAFILDPGVLSPDEEAGIGPGITLEIENELVFVTDYVESTRTVTCKRDYLDSGGVAHIVGALVHFPTRWPRFLQEQSIRDSIEGLNADLFIVKEIRLTTNNLGYVDLPLSTTTIIEVIVKSGSRWIPVQAELFKTHGLDDSVAAMQVETGVNNVFARVRYGVSITVPTLSTAEIVDLPSKWERLILVDAALSQMSGVDIDAVTQEYITESMRLERFPVRSGESIVRALIQLREYLLGRLIKEQKALNPPQVRNVDTVVFG